MPNLKSMLITSQEKREGSLLSVEDKPSFPYGLKIEIDEDTAKKLGLTTMPSVGDFMNVIGRAEVVSVRKEENVGDDHGFSFSLQIQDLDVSQESLEKKASDVMYGGES